MNELLAQFLAEAREALEGIGEKLMQLEAAPEEEDLMIQLFRLVHTLKGNSGLFEFPEMTRVLHAGEDLMDAVRSGSLPYSQVLADALLDAMDFVGVLCDDIERGLEAAPSAAADAARLALALRALMGAVPAVVADGEAAAGTTPAVAGPLPALSPAPAWTARVPASVWRAAQRRAALGVPLLWLHYTPAEDCFFQGEDPLHQARQTPGLLWGGIRPRAAWPALAELDAYRCMLDFDLLLAAPRAEVEAQFRYVPDQIQLFDLGPAALAAFCAPAGASGTPVVAPAAAPPHVSAATPAAPATPTSQPAVALPAQSVHDEALANVLAVQREVLALPDDAAWLPGRIKAAVASLTGCLRAGLRSAELPALTAAAGAALQAHSAEPLAAWLAQAFPVVVETEARVTPAQALTAVDMLAMAPACAEVGDGQDTRLPPPADLRTTDLPNADLLTTDPPHDRAADLPVDAAARAGRRTDEAAGVKSLKVDQVKIDRLMNLIGEMVVAKNAIPYLANRAETVYGLRELSREIKSQYAVINRISEEMQDAIMQVRMMPVSFVFQRFPRLVRDTSRRLGKQVHLVLEGQDTAADKNIIESLGDPLVHIVRNSLDHGLELPEARLAAGKPAQGTLRISARQENDRVLIEISDDGKGIDPVQIKHKAHQKGLIDAQTLERISDQEAVNLVFLPGFSTAEVVSDLSGRGVGMDVVRTAVERVHGNITLDSVKGQGTCLRLSLPLSMAVTKVMTIESDGQAFGVPMDLVVETVRLPRAAVRGIKQTLVTLLRGKVVPLKALNGLLGLAAPPLANDHDELAVLVVRTGEGSVGLLVDDFRETSDIILKPLSGVLTGLRGYAGSALMGDGSVLMVLDIKEIV